MSKKKTIFLCQSCGYESNGWLGKCPACNGWNSFAEELLTPNPTHLKSKVSIEKKKPVKISEISIENAKRYLTRIEEFDRVLGGGMVKGSLILIGGDPGIGKSTLILQMCQDVEVDNHILYVSGEESVSQLKLRADRLCVSNEKLKLISETDFETVEDLIINDNSIEIIIIDSIQTMFLPELSSAPGSVSQVREVTARLMRIAKTLDKTIIVVGHVTKEGSIAGPRVLEHMVDTVLYFEGERNLYYRILRSVKNRFGSTNEIGMFEMKGKGLIEVKNPSEILISGRPEDTSGSIVVCIVEGTRPVLIEIQALTSKTVFGMPRRMATGIDYNRLSMLIAVLEKKGRFELFDHDAYINVVGGFKANDTACDLGVIIAIASSFKNKAITHDVITFGEVGLTGEVRNVTQIDKRLIEAIRNGFKKFIIPKTSYQLIKDEKDFQEIEIIPVENINQALDAIFK